MSNYSRQVLILLMATILSFSLNAEERAIPKEMQTIMQQPKYQHASWGILVKDSDTGKVLIDLNSNQMFLPASTTKLFSVAALLHAYGDNYRFKTPIFTLGTIKKGTLDGNIILVAQGDLTMGGRQDGPDKIAFTKMDHIIANEVPGTILTKGDPLHALNDLAKQIYEKGIRTINGDVLIDDRLFKVTEKRDMLLSPILINENLIDFIINPGEINKEANLTWRPQVEGYTVKNELKTVFKGDPLDIKIRSDDSGRNIIISGTIPMSQKELVRTFAIKDPSHFARAALIQALRAQEITVNSPEEATSSLPEQSAFKDLEPLAVWISPPLSEYAKLILKVSHNLGADLIPLLLAVRKGKQTFDEGILEIGHFLTKDVKISPDEFVLVDAAGADSNRLTPHAEVELLEYMRKLPQKQYEHFVQTLPILGVDGSLADFGKSTKAIGKVHAKPGTGMSYNIATSRFFLTTQTLAGYIQGKNGHLIEFMLAVNNGNTPTVKDVFPVFEDLSQMTGIIFDQYAQD